MWEALIGGVLIGLSISILVGPLFFTMLNTTLASGRLPGIAVAAGVWSSDIIFATGTFYGLRTFASQPEIQKIMGFAGSLILVVFGITILLSHYKETKATAFHFNGIGKYWMKGFMINFVNPFTVLFWIGLSTTQLGASDSTLNRVLFFGGLLGVIAIADTTKIMIAGKIKPLLTIRGINIVRNISGAAICIFGVVLFVRTFLLEQ